MSWEDFIVKTNYTEKSYLNVADLNRIEENIQYLTSELKRHGYNIEIKIHDTWKIEDIPTTADIKRICDNITAIINSYFIAKDPLVSDPEFNPGINLRWHHINDLEENLRRLNEMLEGGVHCNTYQDLNPDLIRYTYLELAEFSYIQLRRAVLPNDTRPRMLPEGQVVSISNKGNYSPDATYSEYDYVVSAEGNGFLAKEDNIIGIAPPDTSVDSPKWRPWTW